MKYATASAFRVALEERLRHEHTTSGTALVRLRKMVAFDRFLARLSAVGEDRWVLKGGFALQLMLPGLARTTKDIDLHLEEKADQAISLLVEAASLDLEDFFSFLVSPPTTAEKTSVRVSVECRVDGRVFERFHVDLGTEEPRARNCVCRTITPLLAFAGIPPVAFPCYSPEQHLAEKVHALTRPRGARDSSRSKDLVDIVILAENNVIDGRALRAALEATFAWCATHPLPVRLLAAPRSWEPEYRRTAEQLELKAGTLAEGEKLAATLVDPVLEGRAIGRWEPAEITWKDL